jgi:hypothetical protein
MVKIYLFIELVRTADANDVVTKLEALKFEACRFANVVVLADDKIVAQLDCDAAGKANAAILDKIIAVDGIVQANVIAAVQPVQR